MTTAELKVLLEEIDGEMNGIEDLLLASSEERVVALAVSSTATTKGFSISKMIRPPQAEESNFSTSSGPSESPHPVGNVIREPSDEHNVVKEDAGMVTDPLPVITTHSRGVGESHIVTKDAYTLMTVRIADDHSVAPTLDLNREPIPTEGMLLQTLTSPLPRRQSRPSRGSFMERRLLVEDAHWELLMRSSDAARKSLRDRAVAANKGELQIGGRQFPPSLSEEFISGGRRQSNASNISWPNPSSSPGQVRRTSLPVPEPIVAPSLRRRSDPYGYSQYKALVFDDSKDDKSNVEHVSNYRGYPMLPRDAYLLWVSLGEASQETVSDDAEGFLDKATSVVVLSLDTLTRLSSALDFKTHYPTPLSRTKSIVGSVTKEQLS
ncbi:hypothetical protein FOL47_009506, partial [Perkinsus chesapeaki]